MGLGLVYFRVRVRVRVRVNISISIGCRVRISFYGSFRVRVGFWLGPSARLDPMCSCCIFRTVASICVALSWI